MSHRSIELALYTTFGAIALLAQTAPLGSPFQIDLCTACIRQDIHVPVTPGNRLPQTSSPPRIAEVRANGVPDSELISLFTASWSNTTASNNRSSLDIAISDTSRLRKAGTYQLVVETVPGAPKLTAMIRVPFAVLRADRVVIHRSPFDPPFGSHTFMISERSGKAAVSDLQAVTLEAALLGANPVSGQIEFDFPPISAGQTVEARYRLKGRFPLGVVGGSSVFISPRLEQPIVVNWEVRSTLGFGWVLLYASFGVVLKWLLTSGIESRRRRRQARSLAYRRVARKRQDLLSDLADILAALDNEAQTPRTVDSIRRSLRSLFCEIRNDKSEDQLLNAESVLYGARLTELRTAIVDWQKNMTALFVRLAGVPQFSPILQLTTPVLDGVTATSPIETASDIRRLINASAIQLTRSRQALSMLASALLQARQRILPQIRDPRTFESLRRSLSQLIGSLPGAADDPDAALRGLDIPIGDFISGIAEVPDFLVMQTDLGILQSETPVVIRVIEPTPIRFFVPKPVQPAASRVTADQAAAALLAAGAAGALYAAFIGTEYDFFRILFLIGGASLAFNAVRRRGTPESENDSASAPKGDPNVEIAELLMSLDRFEEHGNVIPPPGETVLAQERYKLRFQIPSGNVLERLRDRAFGGSPMLEVAIQGKDFKVEGPVVQSLSGAKGNDAVQFTVRKPKEQVAAQLRVLIYYRNHLVQSFLVTADMESNTSVGSPTFAQFKREFSAINDLTSASVKELQPRLISLAINSSPSGSHQLFVKGRNAEGDILLNDATFDQEVIKMRVLLENATWADPKKKSGARIYTPITAGQPIPQEVDGIIRSLAEQGRSLYDALFDRVDEESPIRPALAKIRTTSDERLQVVRFDVGYVFPWTLVYDFDLPDNDAGAAVCLGYSHDSTGKSSPCRHKPDSGVYCVQGFWGVRHQVEECLRRLAPGSEIARPPGVRPVRLLADEDIISSTTLQGNLMSDLGENAIEYGPVSDTEIMDLLWKEPPARPAVLIVLGHMEEKDERIRLKDTRNQNTNVEGFFSRATLSKRNKTPAPWGQPRPIVLLMACESGATTVKTVNNFVTALNTAGASAIVGTECIIDSQFAADFARSITVALLKDKKSLGEAITAFRRESLKKGLPLAFAFNAIGNVDLKIQ